MKLMRSFKYDYPADSSLLVRQTRVKDIAHGKSAQGRKRKTEERTKKRR